MFRYYVNGKWKTLADGESSEPIGCNYYEYEGLTYLKDTGSQKYEMLFARTSDEQFYWLASQTIDTYTSVSYDLYCVDYGMIHSATYGEMASSRGSLSDQALGVRPVVSLESDINISGGIGTSEDPFQIK